MLRIGVELGPYAYHEAAAHGVDGVHHLLGTGITVLVELMTAPLVVVPVLPVLDDVVDGDAALAELPQRADQLELVGIALAALPVAHGPFGHDLRLARQGAVAAYDLVDAVTLDEVIVDAVLHLAPPGHLVLEAFVDRAEHTQAAVAGAAVRLPFDTDGHAAALLQVDGELVAVGVPGGTPDLGDDKFAVDEDLGVAGIIQEEAEGPALLRLDLALEGDVRPGEIEVGCTFNLLALRGYEILLVDGRLAAYLDVVLRPVRPVRATDRRHVSARKGPFFAVFVIQGEHLVEVEIVPGISPAQERIAVPEYAVVPGRDYERNRYLGVVLVQLFILAFVVPLVGLMLAESVESFVVRGGESLPHCPSLVSVNLDGGELPGDLLADGHAVRGSVADAAVSLADGDLQGCGSNVHRLLALGDGEIRPVFLRYYNKRLFVSEFCSFGNGLDMDDVVGDDLYTYGRAVSSFQNDTMRCFPDIAGTGRSRQAGGNHQYGGSSTHNIG